MRIGYDETRNNQEYKQLKPRKHYNQFYEKTFFILDYDQSNSLLLLYNPSIIL